MKAGWPNGDFVRIAAFFIGGILLGRCLVLLPLQPWDGKTLACLAFGIAPVLFLGQSLTGKYFCAWIMLPGAGGIIYLLGNQLQAIYDPSAGAGRGSHNTLAFSYYLALFFVGLFILLRVTRGQKKHTSAEGATT